MMQELLRYVNSLSGADPSEGKALVQVQEIGPKSVFANSLQVPKKRMAGTTGLEPAASAVTATSSVVIA
jgi:hypothetical protein